MNFLANPRHAAFALCAMAFVIVMLLLGQPEEPVSAGSIVGIVVIATIAVVSLIWAYRGPTIRKWWRLMQYSRQLNRYFRN